MKKVVVIIFISINFGGVWRLQAQQSLCQYDSLIHLLRSLDKTKLASSDETQVSDYLIEVNYQIKNYLSQKYPQYLPIDFIDVNDPSTILFGIFYAACEGSNFKPIPEEMTRVPLNKNLMISLLSSKALFTKIKIPNWLRCVVDVTLGYFDIRALISELGTFEFGTVWKVVKSAIKKYVGWIGAAILLYDIGTECFL